MRRCEVVTSRVTRGCFILCTIKVTWLSRTDSDSCFIIRRRPFFFLIGVVVRTCGTATWALSLCWSDGPRFQMLEAGQIGAETGRFGWMSNKIWGYNIMGRDKNS